MPRLFSKIFESIYYFCCVAPLSTFPTVLITQFGSWFLKKNITSHRFLYRGACIDHKSLNEVYNFFFSALKLLLCGLVALTDMNTYLQNEEGVSKHPWKKIIQLLWIVVSYLLKNVKYEIEHNINNTYGDIRHLWNLQQIS